MFPGDRLRGKLQSLPITRAPDIGVVSIQQEVEDEEFIEEAQPEEEEPTQLKPSYPAQSEGQKMNVVAPTYLGCSDKTGMRYYRELKYFFPPGYLATGTDRSPSLTAEGIAVLVKYKNLSPTERYQYKERLQQEYAQEFGGVMVNEGEVSAVALQIAQLVCDKVRLRVGNFFKQEGERIGNEAEKLAGKYGLEAVTRFYKRIGEQLEQLGGDEDGRD